MSWRSCASRLDSGSSIRHTGASAMIARPSATRCCWPPESCDGLRSSSCARPEQVGDVRASRRADVGRRAPCAPSGRTRCSRRRTGAETARSDWNTIAMLRCDGGRFVTSRPAIETRPPSACSRPAMRRSVVDLPQPDGPSSTLSVPSSKANERPSTARTSPSAVVQCLLRFSATMADTRSPSAMPRAPRQRIIAPDERAPGRRSGEQPCQRGAGIRRAHERLADQEGVHARARASSRRRPARGCRSR